MKSEDFNFKSDSSEITGRRKQSESDDINWDRIVYLSFIGILLLVGLYYLGMHLLYISGHGQVMGNRFTLRAPVDARIIAMHVNEGDAVQRNDSLFTYRLGSWADSVDSLQQYRDHRKQLKDELQTVNNSISLQKQKLAQLRTQLEFYQNRKNIVTEEVELGVRNPETLRAVESDILNVKSDLAIAKQELTNFKNRRSRLQNQLQSAGPEISRTEQVSTKPFLSPVNGRIVEIYQYRWERVFRSERILTMSQDSSKGIYIRALFSRENADQLNTGDLLDVEFNNGVSSKAVIRDVYMPQSDVADGTFGSGVEPVRKVVVELEPADEKARKKWQANSRMGVEVTKFIF